MLKQDGQIRGTKFSLIEMVQQCQEVFIKYKKSIDK